MSAAAGGRCGSEGDGRVKERESGWLVKGCHCLGCVWRQGMK